MMNIHHSFSEIDSDYSFSEFASALGANVINNKILIPSSTGFGSIKKIKFEEGLHMRAWDTTYHTQAVFNRVADNCGTEKQFHVVFFFSPEILFQDNPRLGKKWKATGGGNMMFFSNDADMQFEIKPTDRIRAIDISITTSWIKNAFNNAGPLYSSFIHRLQVQPSPTVFFEATSANDYNSLVELHEEILSMDGSMLHIRAGILSLLSNFFDRVVHRSASEVLRNNIFYYDKMLEAKKIIVSHTMGILPSIDNIAKQVALSPSTLKRNFKLMFQKSIYEYYLDQKMETAMRMLKEKPLSVNEVAATLGYEKSSNFIEMFKKHFGVSPGSLRKKAG